MKKFIKVAAISALIITGLTACGKNPEITQFQNDIDSFCTEISEINTAINSVNATSDTAVNEVLTHLDELDQQFQDFAELDFPKEFDYLENLADEAGTYMKEAVNGYRDAYTNDEHNEASMTAQFEYATENYNRAYKRVQIIVAILHGENPEDLGLVEQESTENTEETENTNNTQTNT